jgi:hypothetical protein
MTGIGIPITKSRFADFGRTSPLTPDIAHTTVLSAYDCVFRHPIQDTPAKVKITIG